MDKFEKELSKLGSVGFSTNEDARRKQYSIGKLIFLKKVKIHGEMNFFPQKMGLIKVIDIKDSILTENPIEEINCIATPERFLELFSELINKYEKRDVNE